MTQLTMGQRIASRRKLLNLSQEALSEQLNVSRQAISKWESDAAIPEVDKLIALGRIFGVSVGWLLGTEEEAAFNPRDYFTEAQLEMLEEIVARHHPAPKPSRWKIPAVILGVAAVIAGFWLYCRGQLDTLTADNAAAQAQITQLMEDNQNIQSKIDEMSALLEQQRESEKLLAGYDVLRCNASDDLTAVTLQLRFIPRLYQESCTAYLSIENPAADYSEMVECPWNYDRYFLQIELPRADGYRYSFLLVSDSGYEEQLLELGDYFTDLDSHMRFRLGTEEPVPGESKPWPMTDGVYTYDIPIYTPVIYPDSEGYVPFRDIIISLRRNGTVIWEQSFRQAFEDHAGPHFFSLEPLLPQIAVDLPELGEGDHLTLELTAESYAGLTYQTLLDDRTVTPG